MHIIVCVDDNLGMTFNRRRQSRDRVVRQRIAELTRDGVLWMNHYSARQFAREELPQLRLDEDFLSSAGAGEFCFVENEALTPWSSKIERIYLYRWNRRYPSDRKFDLNLEDGGWVLERSEDFPGFSHETITEEVYTR